MGLIRHRDRVLNPWKRWPGLGVIGKPLQRGDMLDRRVSLWLFPAADVVDPPFFDHNNFRGSRRRSMTEQQNPGDYEPGAPEQR
jgi:hypothetical protein